MNITTALYLFDIDDVIIKNPFEVIKETNLSYITKNNGRYFKSKIGKPILKSATSYPYVEVFMIDADENDLRKVLSEWFANKAKEIAK